MARARVPHPPRPEPTGPALGMLVVCDIPLGFRVLDALAKEASIRVLGAGTIHCGDYLLVFSGEVEATERSFRRGLAVAGKAAGDRVFLPHVEERIVPALSSAALRWPAAGDTLGVLQAPAPPTLVRAVDAALKGAHVELVELRIGDGLGGKAIASLWGRLSDVEAASSLAEAVFLAAGVPGTTAIVPNADPEVHRALGSGSRFFKEPRG